MPETVLFESEESLSRTEIASYFRQVADKLEAGDDITLTAGGQSVTLKPSSQPMFEVKTEREGSVDGRGELSIEFEIEWDENGDNATTDNDVGLEIE